jgi:dTDP-glucose pyrophosphorylase
MAGLGSRFSRAGYREPKPLIPIFDRPMIEHVIANLRPSRPHRFVFVVQREHLDAHGLGEVLRQAAGDAHVVALDGVTEGAACTVLTARERLDPKLPLMIANCDQWLDMSVDDYLAASDRPNTDGLIMTMPADNPKWSFVKVGTDGLVTTVVEKQVISHQATVGVYNFRRAADFLGAADQMIAADRRVNGEFYVAPVYNELIGRGAAVRTFDIGAAMWGLGTPEDLALFVAAELLSARS